jgi:hypothetical protein
MAVVVLARCVVRRSGAPIPRVCRANDRRSSRELGFVLEGVVIDSGCGEGLGPLLSFDFKGHAGVDQFTVMDDVVQPDINGSGVPGDDALPTEHDVAQRLADGDRMVRVVGTRPRCRATAGRLGLKVREGSIETSEERRGAWRIAGWERSPKVRSRSSCALSDSAHIKQYHARGNA